MEISIDESALHAAINKCTHDAVVGAMDSYEITNSIKKSVVDAVIGSALAETVAKSIASLDMSHLHDALASEMSRTVTRSVTAILRESAINVLLSMRGIESYEREKTAEARKEIEAQLNKAAA